MGRARKSRWSKLDRPAEAPLLECVTGALLVRLIPRVHRSRLDAPQSLFPYVHHFSIQGLTPGNRTEHFGNVFLPNICFLLTAIFAPTTNDIGAVPKALLAAAIRLAAAFHFKVQAAFKQVDLGEWIFSFSLHREAFLGSQIPKAARTVFFPPHCPMPPIRPWPAHEH